MPIAYNINLYLADPSGTGILFETMDGEKAYEQISPKEGPQYLCGTNHIIIEQLKHLEPAGMNNSIVRYDRLKKFAEEKERYSEEEIRKFMLAEYPEGMTAHYYKDGFGTIKTVILDPVEKRYSICWLGQEENGWKDYLVDEKKGACVEELLYRNEDGNPEFFAFRPIG